MQTKNHMTKLIKFSWQLKHKGCEIRLHYINKNWDAARRTGCRKWRNRFQNKKFVILAEYFEQQTNCIRYRRKMSQSRNVLRWGMSPIYLSSCSKWKPCHWAINSRLRNLRTALKKYFRFQGNCKQLRIEARNSMANSEIYFPIFSETIHTILKIFSQHDLRKVR